LGDLRIRDLEFLLDRLVGKGEGGVVGFGCLWLVVEDSVEEMTRRNRRELKGIRGNLEDDGNESIKVKTPFTPFPHSPPPPHLAPLRPPSPLSHLSTPSTPLPFLC